MDISWNGFAADSCKILGVSLKNNSYLKELDISSNRVDAESVGHLLKGLQVNDTLSILKVSQLGHSKGQSFLASNQEINIRDIVHLCVFLRCC